MRSIETCRLQNSFRVVIVILVLLLTNITSNSVVIAADEEGLLRSIKQKYDTLSPKGKFAAGCTLGFVGSRVALHTAVSCIKVGAAAYITSEALSMTGVMNDLPGLSDEQKDIFSTVKNRALRETNKYRVGIRNAFSRKSIQQFFDNEKPAAMGLVGGALAATFI